MAKAKNNTPGTKAKSTSKDKTVTNNPVPAQELKAVESAAASLKPETKVNAEPRMFEVRKSDARRNVVPINVEEEIRRRAYELYQQRGPGSGGESDDWFAAEREVMQRYHQQSA